MDVLDGLFGKEKYDSIVEKFQYFFRMKGLKPENYFDGKVWFLKNDNKYLNLIKNSTPTNPRQRQDNNKVLAILKELNGNNDLKNLYIRTDDFIHKISQVIFDSHCSIEIVNNNIESNNSLEKIAKINELLNLLKHRIEKKKKDNYNSQFHVTVTSLNNFPSGHYRLHLLINTDFEKENPNELNDLERRNMIRKKEDSVYRLFEEEKFDIKNLITIPEKETSVNFNTMKSVDKYVFDEYEFSSIGKLGNNYLVDRRNSGTTFSCYKLKVVGEKDNYESENEYFLHLLISSVDDLCDLNSNILNKTCNIEVKEQNNKIDEARFVKLRIEIEFDNLTKVSALNRVKNILSVPIDNKVKNQSQIDEILVDYFPELKDQIEAILNEKEKERDTCCAKCNII